jgi:hypothetical protein
MLALGSTLTMATRRIGIHSAERLQVVDPGARGRLARLSLLAAMSASGYGLYRAYYGFGGTLGMFGVPASGEAWRAINLWAAGLLFAAAVLPIVALPLWRRRWIGRLLLLAAWVIAVACIGHALINDVLRILSLAGRYDVSYPPALWLSVDRRAADLQDLLFNEVWFLLEGLLWLAIGWTELGPSAARRRWAGTAILAIAGATLAGLLSAFGVLGRLVI